MYITKKIEKLKKTSHISYQLGLQKKLKGNFLLIESIYNKLVVKECTWSGDKTEDVCVSIINLSSVSFISPYSIALL